MLKGSTFVHPASIVGLAELFAEGVCQYKTVAKRSIGRALKSMLGLTFCVPDGLVLPMLDRLRKRPAELNLSKVIVEIASSEAPQATGSQQSKKNPAAVALGRLGGAKEGEARSNKHTPEERRGIDARCKKQKPPSKPSWIGQSVTAEVAIINRIAVTLAADSAMTLSGDMPDKIYNSADKIFELSHHDPLALMVYNNLEYAGYPIDVAIKSFRTSSSCSQFSNIDEAVEAFFSYIASLPISKESETNHVKQISYILFAQISREFIRVVEKDAGKNLRRQNPRIDLHQMFTDVCLKGRKSLEVRERIATLSDVTVPMLEDEYATSIDEVSSDVFENLPLNDEDRQLLRSVVYEAILSDYFSRNYSGLVFSGYVAQQMFPSMRAFEVDGIFLGRIKRRCTETLEIDQNGNTAAIIPFAQKEMVDRFIFGIDPDFATAIPSYMSDQILKIGEEIIRNFGRIKKSKKKALLDKVKEAAAVAAASFTEDALEEIKLMKRSEILDVLRFMPKKELADFAESLVYITAIKRKFSSEQETVGGPIDVAVISRSDGFVWVTRKHYFDNALNPRYFYRKFGV